MQLQGFGWQLHNKGAGRVLGHESGHVAGKHGTGHCGGTGGGAQQCMGQIFMQWWVQIGLHDSFSIGVIAIRCGAGATTGDSLFIGVIETCCCGNPTTGIWTFSLIQTGVEQGSGTAVQHDAEQAGAQEIGHVLPHGLALRPTNVEKIMFL